MFLYTRYSDNLANAVIPEVSDGFEETGYPPSNLGDGDPSRPAKLTSLTGAWIWDFGTAKSMQVGAIIHHNLGPSATVVLQGNTVDSWGAPPFDEAFPTLTRHANGFRPGLYLDLRSAAPSYRFWRIAILTVNDAPIAIGEVILSESLRELVPGIRYKQTEKDVTPSITHRTMFGVQMTYGLNVEIRRLEAESPATEVSLNDIRQWWWDAHGSERPFLVIKNAPDPEVMLMRFDMEELETNREMTNFNPVKLNFIEASRGLFL